jgi:AcrR family transcriptional regulator
MTMRRRLNPDERKAHILSCAVSLAQLTGYLSLTRDAVAQVAVVSPALITRYFYCTDDLRASVMREAVRLELAGIVAEGLAARCPVAQAAPLALRQAAAASLGV